ncbi:uncharacterized protein MEPE_02531 [Melanopsichium pennsylvanicum]|uniref:Uncharacterized protein n=2 Tax=Melanopsichium pennsylvanicum TaxID=63383 RepID=A0AAJ4XKK9_9BASI|nr:putative protein [Melanopsichium pennsylvanicum 4]SNX83823.1 uncharacterized protein MEPE_02531 [Melanopsichium pennsylvanicum]
MTDVKSVESSRKQRRPFVQLPASLIQLVDDRLDEDQYDQAVEILEQLRAEGVTPSRSLIQKLVALSLCSLAPSQLASNSRWTMDLQFQAIAARLMTQPKARKSDRNVMKAASAAADRPSQSAVLKATSLLLQYSRVSTDHDTVRDEPKARTEDECKSSSLARHILESLPSQRNPLDRDESSESPRRSRSGSFSSENGDHAASFEDSSIERWVRQSLHQAEDVWDLLCERRFSGNVESKSAPLKRVSEFWMNDSELKRYHKQLQASNSHHQRVEDRIKEIQRKKRGGVGSDLLDTDTDDSSDDEDFLIGISIPDRKGKRCAKSKGDTKVASPIKAAKRARTGNSAATKGDDDEKPIRPLKLTEGAWRTLSVLIQLWKKAASDAGSEVDPASNDEPPLLWQFPRSHTARRTGRSASGPIPSKDTTDDIGRALDVAFSFPDVLPAYTPSSSATQAATGLFDFAKSCENRGHDRLISSVPEAELVHRQELAKQQSERCIAERAEVAAELLASVYELAQLKHVSSVAFIEGVSDRLEALRAYEVQCLMLPLLSKHALVVANVLTAYLEDATETRPDKKRSPEKVHFRFANEATVAMDGTLAYATPSEEKAIVLLKKCSQRAEDRDAKAVLDFLAHNRLELDTSTDFSSPMSFPTKSDSHKMSMVHKQTQKSARRESSLRKTAVNSADAAAEWTEDMEKGGLTTFAFVRATQMEARDRINRMKFLVARALFSLRAKKQLNPATNGSHTNDEDSAADQSNLRLFLTRLIKAFQHDANDFKACVSAMRSHISKDTTGKHHALRVSQLDQNLSERDGEKPALPSLDEVVERCQTCLDATKSLMLGTQGLLKSVPKAS